MKEDELTSARLASAEKKKKVKSKFKTACETAGFYLCAVSPLR
jgi:hypothetical protein